MKKSPLFLQHLAIAAVLMLGCEQGGLNKDEDAGLLESLFSITGLATIWENDQHDFTIKVVNARTDRSTKHVYIQPNMSFLMGPDNKPVKAGQTVCLNTAYAEKAETDLSGNTVYIFSARNASGVRLYFSLGTGIPDEQGTENSIGQTNSHSCIQTEMEKIRFDWVELTLDGTASACANLTSLEQLGICMSLASQKDSGAPVDTLGWKTSFNNLVTATTTASPSAIIKDDSSNVVRIIGASSSPSSWSADINTALNSKTIKLRGVFNGVADKPDGQTNPPDSHPAGFDFSGTFDTNGTNITLTGSFWDVSTRTNPYAATEKPTTMTINGLTNEAVFAADAAKCAISHGTGASDGGYDYDQGARENNRWAKLFGNLVAGMNTGLWAAEPDNLRWSSDKAYASDCNPYSKMIKENSNSYGDPYSDLLEKVQLNLDESKVNTLVITLLDDGVTGGYTEATSTSYIAGLQISMPPAHILDMKSIQFKQSSGPTDTTVTVTTDQSVVKFPAGIEFGEPFDMIFHYNSSSVEPSITLTLPEDVFTKPSASTISAPGWSLPVSDLAEWGDVNYLTPFVLLKLSGNVKVVNYTP